MRGSFPRGAFCAAVWLQQLSIQAVHGALKHGHGLLRHRRSGDKALLKWNPSAAETSLNNFPYNVDCRRRLHIKQPAKYLEM